MSSRRRFVISRIAANAWSRAARSASTIRREDRYTLLAARPVSAPRAQLLSQQVFKVPENKFRVVAGDVGGAFGTKGWHYRPSIAWCCYAAKKLGRPVKWVARAQEAFLSDDHARDNVTDAELALDKDGKFLACACALLQSRRLSLVRPHPPVDLRQSRRAGRRLRHAGDPRRGLGVFTNTSPTATYRGAGRPEASYVIERLIDRAARELGIDRDRAAPAQHHPGRGHAVQDRR